MPKPMTFLEYCHKVYGLFPENKMVNNTIEESEDLIELFDIKHQGDCTKESCPCVLCQLEYVLARYRAYYFTLKNNPIRANLDYRPEDEDDYLPKKENKNEKNNR